MVLPYALIWSFLTLTMCVPREGRAEVLLNDNSCCDHCP